MQGSRWINADVLLSTHGGEKLLPKTLRREGAMNEQQLHDISLVQALSRREPYRSKPWARVALMVAARAIERGRLLTASEQFENLKTALDQQKENENE
jgi:hypothetical protein